MTIEKQKIIIFIFFLLFVFGFGKVDAQIQELPLMGRIVYVDPGHGGRDPGTIRGELYEKDIVLEISEVLRNELMKKGAIVYMTRDEDEDLSSQWDAKKKRGDLYRRLLLYKKVETEVYLSVHINHHQDSAVKGSEVLYHNINPKNKVLGEILMKNFVKDFHTKRVLKTTDLYMYSNTSVPGVLIECGFLSNPSERALLQKNKYQKKLAESITKSVIEFLH